MDATLRDINESSTAGAFRDFNSTTVHRGPNLAALAIVYAVLSALGSIIAFTASRGAFPPPYGLDGVTLQERFYWPDYLGILRLAAFLQFVASVSLGVFAAAAVSRLRFLGFNVAGVVIALFGGFAAALFMGLSGLFQWTISQSAVATLPAIPVLVYFLSFAMGGVGFVVAFGIFVLPFTVMARFTGLLPRWMVPFGAVIVVFATVASFTLLFNFLAPLVTIVHVLGFIWIIAAGLLVPRTRPVVRETRLSAAA